MPEPLKAMYDLPFLRQFAAIVSSAWPAFPGEDFVRRATAAGWEELELKGRMRRITTSLGETLPPNYPEALDVLLSVCDRCGGFPYLFFPDFVETYGLDDWERSMAALERFTVQSSAEFAIRPFILREPERTMVRMAEWSRHGNEHVRRLASEGCRPRLPWAQALPPFKRDPSPILPILEQLKADPSLYVRKSVANNLNDIAKDHPDVVKAIAARWMGRNPLTDWIVRRGCRSLVGAADPEALALFGYEGTAAADLVAAAELVAAHPEAELGGSTELQYALRLKDEGAGPVRLRLELGVGYVKSGGKVSEKRFLLGDKRAMPGAGIQGAKRIDWKDLSTRKHYAGPHRLALLVNGAAVAETSVLLRDGAQAARAAGAAPARSDDA
ncbi:DNA alkylation repair protein [Paenibacillus sp. MWE-103]|uniref:DNA alkylation repair protein n=1 Tax=Paenibacillus artemisiicola TaxID=1172618 RepID=A0ABS3WIX2_9BACL|nr:DNA alkylation repair protein [Paenibacillus artemisiicola]MBO7748274.1 DNA alkylation repair protein [Paenibacillus artemisiicola]